MAGAKKEKAKGTPARGKGRRGSRRFVVDPDLQKELVRLALEQARADQERRDRLARSTKDIVLDIAADFAIDARDISKESMAQGIHAAFAQMIAEKQLEGVAPSIDSIMRWISERVEAADDAIPF